MKKHQEDTFDFFDPVTAAAIPLPVPPLPAASAPEPEPVPVAPRESTPIFTLPKMRQTLLSWLYERQPAGIGLAVPTRFQKFQADLAAFWSMPGVRHPQPGKTLIIEIRLDRDQCWPDCSGKEELLASLRELKSRKEELESRIREREPGLRDGDTLFEEFQSWNYLGTTDPEYHKCLRAIEKNEYALYRGSRFEQIRRALLAEYTYLAVPEHTVSPEEIAHGWGLLYISRQMEVFTVKEAIRWECPLENKLHLIHNIAAANLKDVLFAHGVTPQRDGRTVIAAPPRRRRANSNRTES